MVRISGIKNEFLIEFSLDTILQGVGGGYKKGLRATGLLATEEEPHGESGTKRDDENDGHEEPEAGFDGDSHLDSSIVWGWAPQRLW